jgi:hypothetical protein
LHLVSLLPFGIVSKTPHSIRPHIALMLVYYVFRNFKLSGACRIQTGHPSSNLGDCSDRGPTIQTERFVDFGGGSLFGSFPRRNELGGFITD